MNCIAKLVTMCGSTSFVPLELYAPPVIVVPITQGRQSLTCGSRTFRLESQTPKLVEGVDIYTYHETTTEIL